MTQVIELYNLSPVEVVLLVAMIEHIMRLQFGRDLSLKLIKAAGALLEIVDDDVKKAEQQ